MEPVPCHSAGAMAAVMAPDLRASEIVLDKEAFVAVLRGGTKFAAGMPAHPDITDEQLEALQHYIRQRARETLPEDEVMMQQKGLGTTSAQAAH